MSLSLQKQSSRCGRNIDSMKTTQQAILDQLYESLKPFL